MFDDLRQQANYSSFGDDDQEQDQQGFEDSQPAEQSGSAASAAPGRASRPRRRAAREPRLLGMTAVQRFVIAVMLLLMVCVLGAFCMLVTGTIVPF